MANVQKRLIITTTRTDQIVYENDCPLNGVKTLEELRDKLIEESSTKSVFSVQSFQNKSSSVTKRQTYINSSQLVAIDLVIDSHQS